MTSPSAWPRAPRTWRRTWRCPEGAADQLAFRYGHAARAVLDLCEERPELAGPIVPGHPDLLAEVVIAARREQARSVADVLLRRTRLGLVAAVELRDADATLAVAELLGRGARLERIEGRSRGGGVATGGRGGGHRSGPHPGAVAGCA